MRLLCLGKPKGIVTDACGKDILGTSCEEENQEWVREKRRDYSMQAGKEGGERKGKESRVGKRGGVRRKESLGLEERRRDRGRGRGTRKRRQAGIPPTL